MKVNSVYFIWLLPLILTAAGIGGCSQDGEDGTEQIQEEVAKPSDEVGAESAPWNKVCPVQGGEVLTTLPTVTYDGKMYGFCCPGCEEKFLENPASHAENLSEDGTEFLQG